MLRGQDLAVTGHIGTPVANNIGHTLVIGGQPSLRKKFILEYALQSWTFLALGGMRPMTAVAVVVIKLAACGLLRSEAEFGVRFAALYIATGEYSKCKERDHPRCNQKVKIQSQPVVTLQFRFLDLSFSGFHHYRSCGSFAPRFPQ